MNDIEEALEDRSQPPTRCRMCGSVNVNTTYTAGVAWRFYCLECGHCDIERLDLE